MSLCRSGAATKGQKAPRRCLLAPSVAVPLLQQISGMLTMMGSWGWGERGKSVTAGDRGARGVSDAPRFSNQVHFFISSYPCPALQLADQQSAAVCFNQAAPPLLQTGPDYRERWGSGRRAGGGRGGCLRLAIAEMEGVKQGTC